MEKHKYHIIDSLKYYKASKKEKTDIIDEIYTSFNISQFRNIYSIEFKNC